ncbi:septum formation family protein [Qaidamihabitans albus]|uniref:septum formation family protein n=1 Tax=Qaidamihabitans albus TaxID=2795733 RepID=UPI0018F10C21|nr:septum formation family protein [Qaidamihabitans albus]
MATLSLTWQPNATWAGAVQTIDQVVGTCHAFETAAEQYSFSDVRPAVPCNQPHQSETAAVGELTGELADREERMTPEKRLMVVNDLCRGPARKYMGAGPRDEVWGVDVMLRLPTDREWQRGLRRYRCELLPKSTTDPSRLLAVTDSMRDVFTEPAGATFRRCWTDLTTEVSCDQPHRSESVNSIAAVPEERFAGAPADFTAEQHAEFQRWAAPICRPTVSEFLRQPVAETPYRPEAHLTEDGGVIECSVALPDGQPLTSGSIAPSSQGDER